MFKKVSVLSCLAIVVLLAISCGGGGSDSGATATSTGTSNTSSSTTTEVKYIVTFSSTWSSTTHPDSFPSSAHFSPLIGYTHNSQSSIWSTGNLSSAGMELMAETGGTSALTSEIQALIDSGSGGTVLNGPGVQTPPSTTIEFTMSSDKPLVSLVTMIAPSPDWFVGVNSVNLIENGEFVATKTIELKPYDAGTDSGSTYTAIDLDSQPKETIFEMTGAPFLNNGLVAPLGTFTFVKQ